MAWHLDTNVCIDVLRGKIKGRKLPPVDQCQLSSLVAAELWTGVGKSTDSDTGLKLEMLLELFPVVPFDAAAAEAMGEIKAHLEKAGTPIGPMDTLIAAHARSAGATLLTSNLKEFRRVPGLDVQAWG